MRDPRKTVREVRETVETHGRFGEDPLSRLQTLAGDMLVTPTLPNIILGGLIGSLIMFDAGRAEIGVVVRWAVAYALSVGLFMLGRIIKDAYAAAADALDGDNGSDGRRGIE